LKLYILVIITAVTQNHGNREIVNGDCIYMYPYYK